MIRVCRFLKSAARRSLSAEALNFFWSPNMAYPTVSAPFGLQPINRIDGMPYAGAIRQIPVAAGFGTAIFDGDTVVINSDGYLVKSTTTNSGDIVGVCLGGQYVNSSGQTVQGQFIPALASTSTNLALAYVVDDPMALFKVAVVTSGTTMGTAGRTVVGTNLALVLNAGNTTTGNSAFAVTLTGAGTTATIPIRVIDVVPETATAADTFTELLVKINTHQYNNTTGV
jgi:hypothetical protein